MVEFLPVDSIRPNSRQPRRSFDSTGIEELAASMREHGVLQPVLVRPHESGYELVAGERRWRAAKIAGLTIIPAMIRPLADQQSVEVALVENLQREDLAPLERAQAYQEYIEEFGVSPERLAERLGESRANVVNYIRLLKLSPEIKQMIADGSISMGHARALAGLGDAHRQLALAKLALRRNLSVRQVESLVRADGLTNEQESGKPDTKALATDRMRTELERSLSQAIGLPVRVVAGRRRSSGKIIITFGTISDFDRFAELVGASVSLE